MGKLSQKDHLLKAQSPDLCKSNIRPLCVSDISSFGTTSGLHKINIWNLIKDGFEKNDQMVTHLPKITS